MPGPCCSQGLGGADTAMGGGSDGRNQLALGLWFSGSSRISPSPLEFDRPRPGTCFSLAPQEVRCSSFPTRGHIAQPCHECGRGLWVSQLWFPSLPRRLGAGPSPRKEAGAACQGIPALPPPPALPPMPPHVPACLSLCTPARDGLQPLLSLPPPLPSKPSPIGMCPLDANLTFC